ncbi:MAG: ArsR family transcriptional regulator [archaeon]|nr:ArsR family transcriptional regulator [archaeon]
MTGGKDKVNSRSFSNNLSGTTLKVYRYLYRIGEPQGIHDVQNGLHLSSTSVASYHLKKLQTMGLVRQTEDTQKYFVDRIIFENMIRFRKSLIPIQIGYLAFFASTLAILLIIFRPNALGGAYVFSVVVIVIACVVFGYQAVDSLKSSSV